jgi:hypothetical protein
MRILRRGPNLYRFKFGPNYAQEMKDGERCAGYVSCSWLPCWCLRSRAAAPAGRSAADRADPTAGIRHPRIAGRQKGSPAFTIKLNDAFIQGQFDTGLGTVPSGETSKTVIEFLPKGDPGKLADGVLQVGSSETVQALVPLGGSGDLVDLKPVTLLDQPVIKTTPRGKLWFNTCSLQADLPSDHDQVEKDMRTIVCYMDVQETAGRTGGEVHGQGQLPRPAPRRLRGHADEAPIQAFYRKKKITNKEIIFKIKWPAPGNYSIEVGFAGGTATVPVTLGSP